MDNASASLPSTASSQSMLESLPIPQSVASPVMKFLSGSNSSVTFSAICIFLMLLFGFIFYYANIGINGNTKSSIFIGYCIWGWIALLSLALIFRIIRSLLGF